MTTNEEVIQEQLNVLWMSGFDDGWFFNGTHPQVEKALDWLKKNHAKGEEFVNALSKVRYEINNAQMILAEIDNDLTTVEEV